MLEKPCFYISDYIEKHKEVYYDTLTRVKTKNDMIGWIKFFLETVIETAKTVKDKFSKVVDLTKEMDKVVMELPYKTDNAKKIIEVMYNEPVLSRKKIHELTNIHITSIKEIINIVSRKKHFS